MTDLFIQMYTEKFLTLNIKTSDTNLFSPNAIYF